MSVAKLSIEKRITNQKRHTVGYVINGTKMTRAQAVQLARWGWINGVRVAKNNGHSHLVGDSVNLYSLPIKVGF